MAVQSLAFRRSLVLPLLLGSLPLGAGCFTRASAPAGGGPPADVGPSPSEAAGTTQGLDKDGEEENSVGRAFSVEVHVDEPAGVDRRSEPVLASVPLPPEAAVTTGKELSILTDAGIPLPLQAHVLSRWNGRPDDLAKPARWVLLQLESDLAANRTKPLRLVRKALDMRPERPVKVTTESGRATLDTGTIRVTLGGSAPIEAITDAAGEPLVQGARALLRAADAEGAATTGPPESVEVLEAGPVRGVVRVTGHYVTGTGEPLLAYALTVEGWAGRSELRVSLETRNSSPTARRCVEISELSLALPLAHAVDDVRSPEGKRALSAGDALVLEQGPHAKGTPASFVLGLEGGARVAEGREHEGWLVAESSGGPTCGVALRRPTARAPSGIRVGRDAIALRFVAPGRDAEKAPIYQRWLGDLQHRTDEALVFFDASDPSGAVKAWRSPLVGQPSAAWVRDTGGFLGPLPDVADEMSALGACGLELDPRATKPAAGAKPDAFVGEVNVKWDTESDEARDELVRWVRTGDRAAFDDACAWVDFLRDRYAPRTDGFTFAESEARARSMDSGRAAEAEKRLSMSRLKESHVYGEGLVAHYLLTGDVASLEAARDVAELAAARFGKVSPGASIIEIRVFARPMQTIAALAEVTGEDRYKELLARMTECAFASSIRDRGLGCYAVKLYVGDFDLGSVLPKGLSLPETFTGDAARGFFKRGPQRLSVKGERAAFPYQDRELAHALARAFEATHDERARQALVGLATFYLDEGLVPAFYEPALTITPYFVLPYVPEPQVARYIQPSYPLYATNLGLIEGEAYLVSGDARFLEQAKRCLRIACLRGHNDLRPIGPDERKVRIPPAIQWAHGWDDLATFTALGPRGERKRPAAVHDVVVRPGGRGGNVDLRLVAGDDRAVRWIVLGSKLEIVPEKGDGTKSVAVFGAEPLATVPAKGKTATIAVPVPHGERSFVVLAEDATGALSPPSNVADLTETPQASLPPK